MAYISERRFSSNKPEVCILMGVNVVWLTLIASSDNIDDKCDGEMDGNLDDIPDEKTDNVVALEDDIEYSAAEQGPSTSSGFHNYVELESGGREITNPFL